MENELKEIHRNRVNNLKDLNDFCNFVKGIGLNDIEKVESEFKKIGNDKFLNELINYELKEMNKENYYTPINSSFNGIEIANNNLFNINLVSVKSKDLMGKRLLTGFYHDKIIISLCETLRYNFYKQENPITSDILDKSKLLKVITKNGVLKKGESIIVRKQIDVFSYEGYDSNELMTAIIFSTKPDTSFDWDYDAKTLIPTKLIGNQNDSRIEQACTMLAELEAKSSLKILRNLLSHPKHNIRWEAMKSIMRIDFEEGKIYLKDLEKDKHPEIIHAVEKTQELISKYHN